MKVLQLATSPRPFFEQQVAALERQGVDCTVLTAPGEHEGDSSRSPTAYAKFYSKTLAEVRSAEYDLVHANYGLVAPLAVAQPVRPTVVTLWGTDLMGEHSWLRSLSRFGARRADAAIVPSPAMSRELEVDHELLPFAVDTDLFRPIPQETARTCVGWESDRPIALFPYDRTRTVKDFPRAKRIVERADVDVDLRPVSGVAYEEMPYYMNASDVLLVTSRRESGPMVVKEAAACNLPIVSTDVGFVRETVDGVTNCVVGDDDAELVDGLERVLANGGRTDAREAIDGLGLDSFGERLVGVYRRALGRTDGETDRREPAVGGGA
ncbi:Glycosyl transferase 4-like domain-containing protein [Halobiforma haloterrestris]|uniref:Glycosyl transferase 4-like domain-containing protein n=1 Tax=Natronobacterium haloterrestre TaxID=148448 RepID=A0A1I1H6V6_NATHA|nr:glycosyltransferase [Halobiforma haloterrestris]SFC19496.1 Glycosyl transferase 4-like domain-containing protein [Halobiforma haloterrestris]